MWSVYSAVLYQRSVAYKPYNFFAPIFISHQRDANYVS